MLTRIIRRGYLNQINKSAKGASGLSVADYRSDTCSKPTDKMRDAMANCVVGDEVYGDDPTTNKLHNDMAELLGKEAALTTTSGTQANLIAMMLMGEKVGQAVVFGDNSHLMYYERGGIASIGNVFGYVLPNLDDGTIDMDKLTYHVPSPVDMHKVEIAGISLESSQNNCGGRAIQPAYFSKVAKYAKKHKVKLHLDGARAWNAALHHNMTMKEYVKDFDLVNVCMSKGMSCPAMSVIAGSKKDIDRAVVLRKILGGGMRQTGVLSAACLVSLMDWEEVLSKDNENCKFIADELAGVECLHFDPNTVETNILKFKIDNKHMKKIKLDHQGVAKQLDQHYKIWCHTGFHNDHIRLVTHRWITREHCERTVKALKEVLHP